MVLIKPTYIFMSSWQRVVRYLFASALGSLLTLFVLNVRNGVVTYGTWTQALAASAYQRELQSSIPSHIHSIQVPKSSACVITPQTPVIRNRVWQVFSDGVFEISIYGAYYDDRLGPAPRASVRVFGVSSAPKNKTVLCQIWYKGYKDNPVLTTAAIASPGRGYKNSHGVQYFEYLYSCPVSKENSTPINISLAFQPCQNSTIQYEILFIKKEVPKVQFGVCVATSYGEINKTRLIEWIELLRILGVGQINIYNSDMSNETMRVLKYYEKLGMVRIHDCPPPIPETSYWPRKLAVIPGFNDCVYRNMYRYNYTAILDFDEIIIPKHHSDYTAMINGLKTFHKRLKENPDLIVFRNAYYFLDYQNYNTTKHNETRVPYFVNSTVLSNIKRVNVSPGGYAVKSIFNPRKCVIGWNHYCMGRLPRTQVLNVDPKYALLHHYKKCHFKKQECEKMMNVTEIDSTVMKYKDELMDKISKIHIR